MIYTVYDANGRIRWTCEQFEPPSELPTGYGFVEGQYGAEYYFDGTNTSLRTVGSAVADKTTVTADGVEVVTISGIVPPAMILVTGQGKVETEDSTLELTFDTPGTYKVTVNQVPHFIQEFTINAT